MSKVKVDEDLVSFAWFIGFLIGIMLCLTLAALVNNIRGIWIEKDDKIHVNSSKYRIINIDDSDRLESDTNACTIKVYVNKL